MASIDPASVIVLPETSVPEDISPGDTVRVHAKVVEGNRERIQVFEGVVIRVRQGGPASNFTVRRIASHGVGGYSHTLYRSDARVLHQSRNKVHVAGGYERFQADQTPISTTWSLAVHVRRHQSRPAQCDPLQPEPIIRARTICCLPLRPGRS